MKKKTRSLFLIGCIAIVIAAGITLANGGVLQAAGFAGTTPRQSASADRTVTDEEASAAKDDDLVIIEVQDEETPAADIQVAEDGPSFLGMAVCFAAATAALLVAVIVLMRKYGQLKQETRRLEDEITQYYSVNSGL